MARPTREEHYGALIAAQKRWPKNRTIKKELEKYKK